MEIAATRNCGNSLRKEDKIMKFEAPVIEVKKFDLVDVLTASSATEAEPTTTVEEESDVECEWDVGF